MMYTHKSKILALVCSLFAVLTACQSQNGGNKFPNTVDGVRQMATDLSKRTRDEIKKMAPTMNDCKAIMKEEGDAKKLYDYSIKLYEQLDKRDQNPIQPREGQTEVLVNKVTVGGANMEEEKKKQAGGIQKLLDKMNKDITIYEFHFVEPGKTYGRKFTGLVYANNKWLFIPKMWRGFND